MQHALWRRARMASPSDRRAVVTVLAYVVSVFMSAGVVSAQITSPVADATERRDAEAVRTLIAGAADVNAAQADGATALHWAAHWDDGELATVLVSAGATPRSVTDLGVSPLTLACQNGSAAMVHLLLAAGADATAALPNGETALMTCARAGSVEAVDALIAGGAAVNAAVDDDHGQTALMWAAAEGHAAVVEHLVAAGATVNARTKTGYTPLLFAARHGDVASARALLASDAEIDATAPDGRTALLIAADSIDAIAATDYRLIVSPSGHEQLAILLVERGADVDKADELGMTPLHAAVLTHKTTLLQQLIAHRANVNARLAKGLPFRRGDYVSRAYFAGATPFWLAAKDGKVDLMRLLAGAHADTNLPSASGATPLMVAAGLGQTDSRVPPEPQLLEAVRLARELGGDVHARNARGQTALHGAASISADSIIRYLVEQGADVNAEDNSGRTPLDITRNPMRPRPKTGDVLRELGARMPSGG